MEYRFLTAGEVRPQGWLRRQLQIQARGLCGNLDKIWPDIRDSRWVGGNREGWERVPYWLDGFIPLAWLLEDEDLQRRAAFYVDAILAGQQPDGWICPCAPEERPRYDIWAAFLICKVLVAYHDCTGDARVEEAVYRALRCLDRHVESHTLFNWAAARWFECLLPLAWLREHRREEWMQDFAVKLLVQGMDYGALLREWPYKEPQEHGRWNYLTHVVNLSMCLKLDAAAAPFFGCRYDGFARELREVLLRDHGTPFGHFTGDECLSGRSAVQGTELCGVVEAMYSYEQMLAATGDPVWADRLEQVAYNALPAAFSPDMWAHQYDQMTNQVQCAKMEGERPVFRTNNGEAHLFGLEPHFGCCTANMGQGWPKLALSAWLQKEGSIAIGAITPAEAAVQVDGVPVRCRLDTVYPFEDGYRVTITTDRPVAFSLRLRIPGEAASARVNGKAVTGQAYTVNKTWQGTTSLEVRFAFCPELTHYRDNQYCARRGHLLFALAVDAEWKRLEYTRDGVERKYPYCDYELYPRSPWSYAFAGEELRVCRREGEPESFSSGDVPVWLEAELQPIDWPVERGAGSEPPRSPVARGAPVTARLIPYGCTDLRMTVMPKLKGNP